MVENHSWKLSFHETGTSTSDLAKAAALTGAKSGSAFLLFEQTAGRGRRGRKWLSLRGGMYVSVLLYPPRPPTGWYALSFATSLAIHDVVRSYLTRQILQENPDAVLPLIGLKWPNDVLVNGGKIAGVLLEVHGDSVIIGSGINIAAIAPIDNSPHPPIGFADFPGVLPGPKELAQSFLDQLQLYYELWEQKGFAPLRDSWIKCALHMRHVVTVTVAGQKLTGVCEQVSEDGAMVLVDDFGVSHNVTTGDVELIG